MLKNKFLRIVALNVFLAFTIISCDDFLSELPDNRTVIDSPKKVSELLTGAYPDNNHMMIAELMSDNADFKSKLAGFDLLHESLYTWETPDFTGRDSPSTFWESCYKSIAQANQALDAIEKLGSEFDLKAQKGEALLVRAYSHFMLVNFWGKHYDVNTAATDLGIPYVLEPETLLIQEYKRNTVKEVYDLIEKDIIEGLGLVENNYNEPRFHFTKDAGNALAVRFYTFKGNSWDEVIKHSNLILSSPRTEIRNDVAVANSNLTEYRRGYTSARTETNLLIASPSSIWARNIDGSRYGLSNDKATELFRAGNGNPLGKAWAYNSRLFFRRSDEFFIPKIEEYFRFTNPTTQVGLPFCAIVLFDKDEVLLNRAEAYVMKEDYTKALSDLKDFLANKTIGFSDTDVLDETTMETTYPFVVDEYKPYYSITPKQGTFIKGISELKRRDFYHEGLRWFDIRRFNIEVSHKTDVDGSLITLGKNDLKKQLQIPIDAIAAGLTSNPR